MQLTFILDKEISPDTPLWRYMKLSTFFLLLRGKVFVPSLRKLQETDPKEMRLRDGSVEYLTDPLLRLPEFGEARDWLKERFRIRKGIDLDTSSRSHVFQDKFVVPEWLTQLSIRRCAWCWYEPSHWNDSMAMWNLYAKDGVRVKTTLASITSAIKEESLSELLVARMEYRVQGVPDRLFEDRQNLKRPFLVKSQAYDYEKEVRLLFQVNTDCGTRGMKISVDQSTLLARGEVVLSPYIIKDESDALLKICPELLNGVDVRFRQSSDLVESTRDPTDDIALCDEFSRIEQPFGQDADLPKLFHEL